MICVVLKRTGKKKKSMALDGISAHGRHQILHKGSVASESVSLFRLLSVVVVVCVVYRTCSSGVMSERGSVASESVSLFRLLSVVVGLSASL